MHLFNTFISEHEDNVFKDDDIFQDFQSLQNALLLIVSYCSVKLKNFYQSINVFYSEAS